MTRVNKPKVFIGSSSEGRRYAEGLFSLLEHTCEPTVWSQDFFRPSAGTFDEILRATRIFDCAVLVATPDDLLTMRGETAAVPRDNVVFELGVFMGALGRERVFIVGPERADWHLPSDLLGVTRLSYTERSDGNFLAAVATAGRRLADTIPACAGVRSATDARSPFLKTLDDRTLVPLQELGSGSSSFTVLGRTAVNLLGGYPDLVPSLARTGCAVKFMIVNPSSAVADHLYGKNMEFYRHNLRSAVSHVRQVEQRLATAASSGSFELRLIDEFPPFSMIHVERSGFALVRVQLNLLHARIGRDRPVFELSSEDPWYSAFASELNQTWSAGTFVSADDLRALVS